MLQSPRRRPKPKWCVLSHRCALHGALALLQSAASTPTHKDELNKLADGALLTPKGVKNAMTPTYAPSCNAACRGLCMLRVAAIAEAGEERKCAIACTCVLRPLAMHERVPHPVRHPRTAARHTPKHGCRRSQHSGATGGSSKHKHVRAVSTVRLWGNAPEFQAKGKVRPPSATLGASHRLAATARQRAVRGSHG